MTFVDGDDDSRLSEDHNTKKVRFKDGSDGVSVDMAVDSDPPSNMITSWKDTLWGWSRICGNNEDYGKILTQGPWIIFGQYLTVQPWTKDFTPLQPYPSLVMAWIRLPGLLGFMYKRKILEAIGSRIGKVTKFDFKTDNRTRGRFARMVVFINLDKPLIS
ncbi:hypothetical protein CXB51_010587 [Gossypium anomalum]|uniref:DUF4283 domain-containing protein n=1 Tax=Gossypium anomalum TaxID=47600 RepID=A0A8J5ZDB3_9ROSI|nr:hypothetical protein CXB51_010587 [Gossypium anomalum]